MSEQPVPGSQRRDGRVGLAIPFNELKEQHVRWRLEIAAAVKRVLDSGWFVLGREVEAFEREFADYVGASHACAVANCTVALHLALLAGWG